MSCSSRFSCICIPIRGLAVNNWQHRCFPRRYFRDLEPKILDQIVIHLIQAGYLTTDGEMVMLGTEAEREFGRSNWKDLYSVISGGGEYRAVTPDGEVVGKLDARFVNSQN